MQLIQTAYLNLFSVISSFNTEKNRIVRYTLIGVLLFVMFMFLMVSTFDKGLLLRMPGVPVNSFLRGMATIGHRNRAFIVFIALFLSAVLSLEKNTGNVKWNWYFSLFWILNPIICLIAGLSHETGSGVMIAQLVILLVIPLLFLPWQYNKNLDVFYLIVSLAGAAATITVIIISVVYYPVRPETMLFNGRYSSFTNYPYLISFVLSFGATIGMYLIYKARWLGATLGGILIGTCMMMLMFTMSRTTLLAIAVSFMAFFVLFLKLKVIPDRKEILRLIAACLIGVIAFMGTYNKVSIYSDPLGLYAHINSSLVVYADEKEQSNKPLPIFRRFQNRYTMEELSSGRTTIWKVYRDRLNWYGHDINLAYPLRVKSSDGKQYYYYASAHNYALESAFRNGIPSGLLILLLEIIALLYVIRSVFCRTKNNRDEDVFVAVMIMSFLVSGNLDGSFPPFSRITVVTFYLALAPLFVWGTKRIEREVTCSE